VDSREHENPPSESRVSRGALQLMALILFALVLLAIFSNVRKARRAQIETVTITPAARSALAPASTPR
jgi:hypothetical protein